MPRRGIVNVRMVITEEKILSNIEKVQRLINPNSKKQIIELDDNSYFKDLVESIKTYLIEYPKKKNFPKTVYDAAYKLVEYATNQFEENTKQIETLIKQREYNIKSAAVLKQTLAVVQAKEGDWKKSLTAVNGKYQQDVLDALGVIARAKGTESQNYQDAVKLINSRISNLESNLHIEIDMERVEDRSKALSYIGIEIADALKLIPTPVAEEPKVVEQVQNAPVQNVQVNTQANTQTVNNVQQVAPVKEPRISIKKPEQNTTVVTEVADKQGSPTKAYEDYYAETRTKVKSSLWNKFKNSKFMRAIKYVMKIRITLQLPEGLPEGNQGNK